MWQITQQQTSANCTMPVQNPAYSPISARLNRDLGGQAEWPLRQDTPIKLFCKTLLFLIWEWRHGATGISRTV